MNDDVDSRAHPGYHTGEGFALSGKIMLSAIVVLFFVVILMVCLHLYARWYLLRARRRHIRRNRHRRTHFVFYMDPANPNPINATNSSGLDSSVLKSLPVFVYSSNTHTEAMDCAVCLSEFEENESGRVLPKCNHNFHIDCIDMWFHSHTTCPLCRSPVELVTEEPENPIQVVIPVSEPGSSSDMCDTCRQECSERFGNESTGCDAAASQTNSQSSSRSPVGRMLSFKRMLSREKRGNSTTSGNVSTCGADEIDIERGKEEIRQPQCPQPQCPLGEII